MDGPDVIEVDVESCDDEDHCSHRGVDIDVLNAPPTLSSPTEVEVMIGEEITYTPEVADPGGDEVEVEVLDRPSGMILLADGGVRWIPLEDDVGDHTLTFIATDDDDDPDVVGDGDAELVVTITVVANQGPGEPTIVSPERGSDVAEIRPTLVVNNPTDPEGDIVFISFEVAETDTYTNAIASGRQPAGTEGTTSWTLTEDLANHSQYYWRVWATDENDAESLRAFSYFRVEAPDEEGDGGVDAGDQDAGPDEEPRVRGCGCGAANGPSSSAGVVVLILFVAATIARIRRS
jgi:MYXO-CTERM domain-containing protein